SVVIRKPLQRYCILLAKPRSLICRSISKEKANLLEPSITADVKEVEKGSIFYTDNWKAFAKILPKKQHIDWESGNNCY
ncbi:MAG: hypothetical protein P0S93_02435, partial [Candidatus Neptunochlamydia sp.]|nr:hypothetical protein [Candidatus Neptunochlamydia sp.]